jgi:hypothetical protein
LAELILEHTKFQQAVLHQQDEIGSQISIETRNLAEHLKSMHAAVVMLQEWVSFYYLFLLSIQKIIRFLIVLLGKSIF